MNKDVLLKELDILKTYFEEVVDGASEDDDIELDTMFMLNNLKGYVEDAIEYVKGEKTWTGQLKTRGIMPCTPKS